MQILCPRCYVTPVSSSFEVCPNCQAAKHLQKTSQANAGKPATGATPVPAWTRLSQDASKVSAGGTGLFSKAIVQEAMPQITSCIEAHQNDQPSGSKDQQNTIWPTGNYEGTVTIDWQGVRAGTGKSRWIDIQGQAGGGGSVRKTLFQIMVEITGDIPPEDVLLAAIRESASSGKRVIIRAGGSTALPPSQ